MNTESQQQIAREAAKTISDWEAKTYGKPDYSHPSQAKEQEVLYGFILSAMRKRERQSAQPQRSENTLEAHTKRVLDPDGPVSQRSEQQEWTPGFVVAFKDVDTTWPQFYKKVADAHKAELTAERQRREDEKGWDEYALKKIDDLETLLLSALAAIEKLHDGLSKFWKHQLTLESLGSLLGIKPDLSLLHEHDTEVRKPLVDALKEINDWVLWIKEPLLRDEDKRAAKVAGIIDDALAKVKQ